VPESDIAHVIWPKALTEMRKAIPLVEFSKGSFKPIKKGLVAEDGPDGNGQNDGERQLPPFPIVGANRDPE
jgi:hypothetical protein